ncbi:MAG: hypothetical protein RR855_04495, partial [Comamonas sp.]
MKRFAAVRQRFWQQLAAEWEGPAGLMAGGHWHTDLAEAAAVPAAIIPLPAGKAVAVQKTVLEQVAVAQAAPENEASAQAEHSPRPLLQVQNVSLVYATAQQQVRATHRVSLD